MCGEQEEKEEDGIDDNVDDDDVDGVSDTCNQTELNKQQEKRNRT